MTETVDPLPAGWPGGAALPIPDVAMPVQAPGVMPFDFFIVQAGSRQFKQC
jgi:hypothetical protein